MGKQLKVGLISLIFGCLVFSCAPRPKVNLTPPSGNNTSTNVTLSTAAQQNSVGVIHTKSNDIIKKSDELAGMFPGNIPVESKTQSIKDNAVEIKTEADKIKTEALKIQKSNESVKSLESKIIELQNSNKASQQEAVKKLYTYLSALFGIGLIIILAGAVLAYLYDKKMGITISMIGVLALGLAAGATFYLQQIAYIGIAIIIAAILVSIYMVIRSLINERKGNTENVMLVDTIKPLLKPQDVKRIFKDENNMASSIQSPTTRKLVSNIRARVKPVTAVSKEKTKKK